MFKLRVYIDTSVIGGCLDEEFKEDSSQLFDEFTRGIKTLVISDVLLFELEGAPDEVKNILKKVPTDNIEYVSLNEESVALADAYIKDNVVADPDTKCRDGCTPCGNCHSGASRCIGELEF